jgi:chaperonin cofactor prefoldin
MVEMAHKNSSLESELEGLKSQIQALQNPPEAPVVEVKRSFREVTLEGEVQSLRAQLTELQHLRAQVPSLQAQLAQLERSLRAAEKRELDQVSTLAVFYLFLYFVPLAWFTLICRLLVESCVL